MTHKLISSSPHRWLMLLLILLAGALSASAETLTYTYKGKTLKYETINNTTCKVASNQAVSGDVEIPSRINTNTNLYTVTSIEFRAFYNCKRLSSIVIPNSVTYIGVDAFDGCSNLKSINIPNSVTSIGPCAFSGCSSLTSIEIPNSVTSIGINAFSDCTSLKKADFASIESLCSIAFEDANSNPLSYTHDLFINGTKISNLIIPTSVISIGNYAFNGCSRLTSVTIPNSATSIGARAFYGCSSLTSIEIPNSVTSIGNEAFDGCSSLTSIKIPTSVTSIGDYAFRGCSSLSSIDIPNSVTFIGSKSFSDCSSLTSIEISNSVTSIGWEMFSNCSSLTSINIPNSVTSIDSFAFSGCTILKSVVIPNSVTSIGSQAFNGCSSLTSIEIPNSVTSIGEQAFHDCSSLTSVTYDAENPINSTADIFSESTYSNATLYLHPSAIDAAYNIVPWGLFENIKSLTENPAVNLKFSFDEATKTCTVIGYEGDRPKGNLFIPTEKDGYTVTSIGSQAFYGCSSLTSINIPNSVTSIGSSAFSHCYSLTSIEIPNSVTSIGDAAFYRCSSLTSIEIPNSVTSIGSLAFNGCTSLSTVIYDAENPVEVGSDLFSNDTYSQATLYTSCPADKLAGISPWNLFEKPFSPSQYAEYLTFTATSKTTAAVSGFNATTPISVTIPETIVDENHQIYTVTTISATAFKGNPNLLAVEIPSTINSIDAGAFKGCTNLKNVVYNACNVSTTQDHWSNPVFENCTALTAITFGPQVVSIPGFMFKTTNIRTLVIPDNVKELQSDCFADCLYLSDITIGKGVETIRCSAFAFDKNKPYVSTTIHVNAVNLKNYLGHYDNIGPNANWLPCKGRDVKKIVFGEDVEQICTYAFCECTPDTVECYRTNPPYLGDGCLYSTNKTKCKLIVPAGTTEAYSAASVWKDFMSIYDTSAIEDITPDDDTVEPVEIYTLTGIRLTVDPATLTPGIYIERRGSATRKIAIH